MYTIDYCALDSTWAINVVGNIPTLMEAKKEAVKFHMNNLNIQTIRVWYKTNIKITFEIEYEV